MAVIAMFYGIIVSMYYFDNRKHHLPHVHIRCQAEESVFTIPDGELLEGKINRRKKKLLQAWIEIHQDELMADWELAINGEQIFRIEPLR